MLATYIHTHTLYTITFITQYKRHWIGENYTEDGPVGTDICCCNLPNIQSSYHHETHVNELKTIIEVTHSHLDHTTTGSSATD